mgnify:FL=1
MSQFTELVEKRRLYLQAEDWGSQVSQHYVCKGGAGDLGFGMGYFVYYNNGAVHKLSNKSITIMQPAKSIDEVIDDFTRSQQC